VNERAAAPKVYEIDHANTGFGVDFQVLRRCAPRHSLLYVTYSREKTLSFPKGKCYRCWKYVIYIFMTYRSTVSFPRIKTNTKDMVYFPEFLGEQKNTINLMSILLRACCMQVFLLRNAHRMKIFYVRKKSLAL